jgi:hypothetical protein
VSVEAAGWTIVPLEVSEDCADRLDEPNWVSSPSAAVWGEVVTLAVP